jgi:hypothetical protein
MAIDEKALQRLLDKEEIREALLRYTRGVDRHDTALAVSAYHPDASDDHGAYIGGVEGVIRHANTVHTQSWDIHHHFITNETIELEGDTAHAETYFLATLRRKTGVIDLVGGRYIDRLERRDGRWAIADRACLVEWNGEIPSARGDVDEELFLRGRWDRQDISYARPLRLTRPPRDLTPEG